MRIEVVQHDCEDAEGVEQCWECGGNIKKENLIWYPDPDIPGCYIPGHAQCVDEDIQISNEQYEEYLEQRLAPLVEEDCHCDLGCNGTRDCSICGPHDEEDANVGYDCDGRPIGG